MSYTHLAGRLIETQRSMLGQPAIDIAQSIDGLTVTGEGNVTGIEGDERAVIDRLVVEYTTVLGHAAEGRLQTAAEEFADELVLPPSLGGPEEVEETEPQDDASGQDTAATDDTDRPTAESEAEVAGTDDGIVEFDGETDSAVEAEADEDDSAEAAPETGSEPADATAKTPEEATATTDDASDTQEETTEADDAATGESIASPALLHHDDLGEVDVPEGETTIVTYQTAGDVEPSNGHDPDLAAVYLLSDSGEEWKTPITVEDAIIDAVTSITDLDRDDVDSLDTYVDPERVLAVLGSGGAVSASFDIEDCPVTIFPSGSVRVY